MTISERPIETAMLPQSQEVKFTFESNNEKKNNAEYMKIQTNIPTLGPCSPATASPSETDRSNRHIWSASEMVEEDQEEDQEAKDIEMKTDEILSCLNGVCTMESNNNDYNDDEGKVVDLWHLRQLAISKRGLVSASIRKRVWPKLVGANEHVFTASIKSLSSASLGSESIGRYQVSKINDLADSDVTMIKRDINDCVWNIWEEIKTVRRKREMEKEQKRMSLNVRRNYDAETTSVASLDSGCSSITAGRITPQLIPESIRAFPRFGGIASPHASGASTPVSGIATPNTMPSITHLGVQSISINENNSIPSVITKVRKSRRKIQEEQAILLGIITSVLGVVPQEEESDDSDFEYDDDTVVADNINKLYYFKGMHNVIGPLLITLESPSLTSLIFNRLAQSHLRDAMSSTYENIQAAVRLLFMPLLVGVDKPIHEYLMRGNIKDPCLFALPWVLCWFTSDVANYDIVTRLFDVFIASHASFPVYLSVAMLTHPASKRRVMMTPCSKVELISVIGSLPSATASESNGMDLFEEMIELAVSYMRKYPFQDLLAMCKISNDELIKKSLKLARSVRLLRKPPSWAYVSFTATDWTLIKQAKAMRGLSPTSRLQAAQNSLRRIDRYVSSEPFIHDLALDISGLSKKFSDVIRNPKKASRRSIKHFMMILLLATTFMLVAFMKGNFFAMNRSNGHIRKKAQVKQNILLRAFKQNMQPNRGTANLRRIFKATAKSSQKKDQRKMENNINATDPKSTTDIKLEKHFYREEKMKNKAVDGKLPQKNGKGIVKQVGVGDDGMAVINFKASKQVTCNAIVSLIKMIGDVIRQDSDLLFIFE